MKKVKDAIWNYGSESEWKKRESYLLSVSAFLFLSHFLSLFSTFFLDDNNRCIYAFLKSITIKRNYDLIGYRRHIYTWRNKYIYI